MALDARASATYVSMRIAQLIDSLTVGGAEKLQTIFARAVAGRGVELTIIALKPPRFPEIAEELSRLDVRVVTLEGRKLFDARRLVRLVRLLRRERFDVLFTHLSMANTLGPVAAALAGTPTIATLHNEAAPARPIHGALEFWALRRLTRQIVAVGKAVAAAHQPRLGSQTAIVVPNPVAPIQSLSEAERGSVRAELAAGDTDFMLMSTGLLTRQKAFADLLEAFADLRQGHPEAKLVIAGGGPLEADLNEQIERLGLHGHARLLGIRSDVPRLLAAVDGYVSSSHWEGLPLSVLEAMAAGLPVVATAVGELPAVMVEGTGLLVEPHRPAALVAALRSLLEDRHRARAMGAAAREHVRRHYDPRIWAERLLELAAEAAREDRRRSRRPADRR